MSIVFLLLTAETHAQFDPQVEQIVREGKKLFRLEMANWYGGDIFKERFPQSERQTGGYFSYPEGTVTKCVFYSREKVPVVLATITFDQTLNTATATVDSAGRYLTKKEQQLFHIRQSASQLVNSDTLFKVYQESSLNLIPLIDSLGKRVYILSAPQKSGIVIFGNDYLIRFNDNFEITEKESLHRGISILRYKDSSDVSYHIHPAGSREYITPTDICTLLLYERFTPWKQHVVISEKTVSIWDIGNEELTVMPRKAWDEIMEERTKTGANKSE